MLVNAVSSSSTRWTRSGCTDAVARTHALGDRAEIIGGNRHQEFLLVVEMACERADREAGLVTDAVEREPSSRHHAQ